jgi:hypothetical protein
MALTKAGMCALRTVATLADVVPSVRIRIRDGERLLITMGRRDRRRCAELGSMLTP